VGAEGFVQATSRGMERVAAGTDVDHRDTAFLQLGQRSSADGETDAPPPASNRGRKASTVRSIGAGGSARSKPRIFILSASRNALAHCSDTTVVVIQVTKEVLIQHYGSTS
jgi:hypothetical protein